MKYNIYAEILNLYVGVVSLTILLIRRLVRVGLKLINPLKNTGLVFLFIVMVFFLLQECYNKQILA